ncbi:unnamed protein product [marine sediment metagenome]|uniref:Uncharacterized protein n=1 Tax=marine sediment metagenome TaxID=412755 RepID=X1K2A4_9ZZZZ
MTIKLTTPKVKVFDQVQVNIAAIAERITMPIDIVACEVTMPITVSGSLIQIPVDIQGSYICCPVDLQAQYVDLDVRIVAQVVNVNIEINAQNVGVKIESEWQSFQGNEKDQFKESANLAWSESVSTVDYAPPEGKDLYITGMAFSIYPAAPDDYDHHLRGEAVLFCSHLGNEISPIGGEGGNGITFPTPIKIPSQKNVSVRGTNWSNITCKMHIGWWGYEA